MAKTLVVAEKPSVGRDIARVLGAKEKGTGCLVGDEYVVTWAIGHLVTLCNPEEIDEKLKQWSFDTLPILPRQMKQKVVYRTRSQYGVVKSWMLNDEIDAIICATDSGREGELIFRRIYEHAGCTKPFRRLWISSMTDYAIRQGFENLLPSAEYDNLYASARCRADADWLVGMNGSRAFSLTYDTLLSVGRVQSPTLAILVSREMERRSFVPQTYYVLQADFGDYSGLWLDETVKQNPHRIPEEKKAEFEALRKALPGSPARVEKVDITAETNRPPMLYDLTQLQRDANRKYGWSASKTLKVAQNLYEKNKVITYPRTDSRNISSDMRSTLPGRLEALAQQQGLKKFAAMAIKSERELFPRVINNKGVTDHHAIIPTGTAAAMAKLKDDEAKLFDMVARRFIAAFLDDQQVERTRVITRCREQAFLSKGSRVTSPGWSALYAKQDGSRRWGPDHDEDIDEQSGLPSLKEGDERTAAAAELVEKQTTPPPPYTEASLLSAMEHAGRTLDDEELAQEMKDSGLGTPATRAAIIDRLIQVRYIRRARRFLEPTEKGMLLVGVLPKDLASPITTGRWEQALSQIGRGEQDPDAFMEGIRQMVASLVAEGKVKKQGIDFPDDVKRKPPEEREPLGTCPACGSGTVMENSRAYYCTNWRRLRCSFTLWKNMFSRKGGTGPDMTPDMIKQLLTDGKITLSNGTIDLLKEAPWGQWTLTGEPTPRPEPEDKPDV